MSDSRYGKTQWARCLGEHVYIANMWDLGYVSSKPFRYAQSLSWGRPRDPALSNCSDSDGVASAFDGIGDSFWHTGYVVFDDISWDSIKASAKSWFGAQRDFTVSDKYRRKRRMPGGVPSIFLINPDAYVHDCYSFINSAWGKENIDVVILRNKLYD